MMHVAEFKAAPVSRVARCSLAIPASNLSEAFKGQDTRYTACALTGHVCRPGAHCAGLVQEARHKGLFGMHAASLGE